LQNISKFWIDEKGLKRVLIDCFGLGWNGVEHEKHDEKTDWTENDIDACLPACVIFRAHFHSAEAEQSVISLEEKSEWQIGTKWILKSFSFEAFHFLKTFLSIKLTIKILTIFKYSVR